MTKRLYYEDSHRSTCEAVVTGCTWDEKKGCFAVTLDQTVFFPEGGGQYADTGKLGGLLVDDVKEREEDVIHYLKEALEVGQKVVAEIDFTDRFEKMQQHTGEHIVSGIVHKKFGYDNVGFHLGKELVTMDFNGTFTPEQLREVEWQANEAVVANIPIQVAYPSKEELDAMDYRSKKELTGQVRIVTIPEYDVCACCAPHVERTGEIGIIKLIDASKYKGGTRVTMVCGFRALQDYQMREDNVRAISQQLSVKPQETAQAVKKLQSEMQMYKDKLIQSNIHYLEQKLQEITEDTKVYLVFEPELDKTAVRKFVDGGMHRCNGICGVFVGDEKNGYQYTIGSQSVDLKPWLAQFHQKFPGKGGGKSEMVQGTLQAGSVPDEIEKYFVLTNGK